MCLTRKDVQKLVDEVLAGIPREECRTCDCFLGFLTQLELDSDEDVTGVTSSLKVPKDQIHGCLGCNPCPPGEAFSNYIKQKLEPK